MIIRSKEVLRKYSENNHFLLIDDYIDWYIDDNIIRNRTGSWYFGVISITGANSVSEIIDETKDCSENKISKDKLDTDFHTELYTFVAYTGGSYFFNESRDEWEGIGLNTLNTTKDITSFTSNHLTSFGTGFMPQISAIDFKFIFAHASFTDNMTIFVSNLRLSKLKLQHSIDATRNIS